jgi:hypothetical protein
MRNWGLLQGQHPAPLPDRSSVNISASNHDEPIFKANPHNKNTRYIEIGSVSIGAMEKIAAS